MRAVQNRTVTRRELLRGALMGLGAAALAACTGGEPAARGTTPAPTPATPAPTTTGPSPSPTATAVKTAWARVEAAGSPPAVRDHTLSRDPVSGLIYLFGGRTDGTASDELWRFDPEAESWEPVSPSGPGPDARFGHNAVFDPESALLVAMGQRTDGSFLNDVWAFDPEAEEWSELGDASDARPTVRYGAAGAAGLGGGRIVISHGFTNQGRFDDTWGFDLESDAWREVSTRGPVPVERCLTHAYLSRQHLFVFGGQTNATPFLGDFWSLDLDGGRWRELKKDPLPGPRNLYGASFDGTAWYLFGGNTPDGPVGDTWRYGDLAGKWAIVDPGGSVDGPSARFGCEVVTAVDRLFLFGGTDGSSELNDTWSLEIAPPV